MSCLLLILPCLLYNYIMKPQSDSNSGARLQLKKVIKQNKPKESQPEEKALKPIAQEKSKEKDNKDKKAKIDEKESKDKKQKKKDQKEEAQDKLSKSKDKDKKDKDKKEKDKKDKKDKDKKGKKDGKDQLKKSGSKSQSKLKGLINSDGQLQTINSIHKSQNKAKRTIEQLIEQYKQQAQRLLFLNKGHDPDKERQIQQQLEAHQKQKEKRHKRLQQLEKHQEQILKSKEKSNQVKLQLRKQKIRERKIKRVEKKLSSLQISAQQRRRDYQKFIQYVKERKKFKPRFKRYEQEYEQYLKEEDEDYRDKLDELARKYEPINQNELASFEQNYLAQRQEGVHYRQNKLKLQQDLIKEENQRREKLLWKGHCHQNAAEEIKTKLQRKKAPWEKQQLIKEYSKFVNDNMKKKREELGADDQQKNQQLQPDPVDQTIAYHQKYIRGVNYGLVPYKKPAPLPLQDAIKKGNSYLQSIKQENKNRKNKTVDYTNSLDTSRKLSVSSDLKKDPRTFRLKKKSNPYYASEGTKQQIDFKNYQAIEYSMQKLVAIKKDRQLNDQIIKHGEYGSILDIQERKRKAGNLVVKQINEKLNILKKL